MNKREECLNLANKCVNGGEREQDYGSPRDCFTTIAKLWSVHLDRDITPADVANMMILLKVARNQHKHKADNWVDICGYGCIGYELSSND